MPRNFVSSLFGKNRKNKSAKNYKRFAKKARSGYSFEALEDRRLMAVAVFQQGAGGYGSQEDTVIFSQDRNTNFGTEGNISADQQDFNNVRQGLLKFGNLFGTGPGQIPIGATINSATLDVFVQDSSNAAMQMSLYRMQTDWSESSATWNSFGAIGGVQASEGEASNLPPDAVLLEPRTDALSPSTAGKFDVTKSLEYWAAGASNFGWLVETAATNGWDFRTKESDLASRPVLTITYDAPAAAANFQILNTSISEAEGNSGTRIAKVEVARLGNIAAPTSINYTVTAGGSNPAQAGDFVAVAVPQALSFGANQGIATIDVVINGDVDLEGLETVLVTLSGGTTVAGRGQATVTIADDDILINEVLANVSNNDDETDREYIELIGTPGANLSNYYFVVFEGEEEENGGTGSGRADFVINLGSYTFGANGLLVFVPGDANVAGRTWEYDSIADQTSNIVELTSLMVPGGVLEDNSQTYALIYSPGGAIAQGTDYDIVGAYENGTETALGTGVGILDQLPVGAQWIDSVGIVEGGGGDRDRVATPSSLGHPGVHVHQPAPFIGGGNVASDAVSRRIGQTLPNSIGAWYNGDISNGNPANAPIRYLEDTLGFISVVSPDGSVLTPGSRNILRTVYFRLTDQAKEVAEADGSVTIRIERTGDVANESLTVTYSTFDFGSADEGTDYTGETDTVTFNPGESFKDITIDINGADGLAEGFERFRVLLSNASAGYLVTNGTPTSSGNPNGEATITIKDANVSVKTFQNGVNGYTGTIDAYLDGELTADLFGQEQVVRVDHVKGATVVRPQQALLKFDQLFGNALSQVPVGSKIFDAFLTLNVTNGASGADIELFRMLQVWDENTASWDSPQGAAGIVVDNGVTPDGFEASSQADAIVTEPGKTGKVQIPLNVETIQSWANDSLVNEGWSIISTSSALWSFNSSEAFLAGTFKPELTVLYTDPVALDVGTFGFSVDDYTVNENGGSATITVNRVGGSNGSATVNWGVTPGTGTLAAITGSSSGSIVFGNGEWKKTFNVGINDDAALERDETLNLTLSGVGLTFDKSAATLEIRDNDFLTAGGSLRLNEIFMNSPGNDPPHEFVELAGQAGMGMGSLYYVAIEGLVGPREGTFDKIVDLGAYTNGSNGLSLLTPQEPGFAYNVNPATTQIQDLGTVAVENVNTNNDSVSIMVLFSPTRDLSSFAFDYDWDNDGTLDLPADVQIVDSIGIRTLGQNDLIYGPASNELSFTAAEVDSISRKRSDSDLNDGGAWFGGNLTSAGDDYLLYEAGSVALPLTGASMSPGDLNAGTAIESPLVSLTSITPNPNGTITVTFNGNISQVLAGDGGAAAATGSGFTITDTNGIVIPVIDSRPVVSGIGTSTLSLSFTGSGVSGGLLPAGNYQLNIVGNGFVANSRAVDVSNNGTQVGGFREFEFNVAAAASADYDNDGDVDGRDFLAWQRGFGKPAPTAVKADGDADNDTDVDGADLVVWQAQYGTTPPLVASSTIDEGVEVVAAATTEALAFAEGTWFALPGASVGPAVTTLLAADEPVSEVSYSEGALADAFFALSDSDTIEFLDSSEDLYSFSDDEGAESAFDEVFAEIGSLALAI